MRTVGEGRLQQGFGCRAGEETGELDLEEQRERGMSAVSLPASVAGVCKCFLHAYYFSFLTQFH